MNKSNLIVFLSAIIICMLAMPAMADYNLKWMARGNKGEWHRQWRRVP